VDWCDAYAYCAGVGKRLCGQIGGGPNGFNDIANAGLSQWYRACVSGGAKNVYPYGSSYQDQTCNGADAANAATVPVGSMSGCQPSATGYEGVHDLSGNVSEWGDACSGTAGQQDLCRVRGGSFASASAQLRCDSGLSASRFDALGMIGLRCCGP
jgi:formylglycine-generating enzyme required for sulfatase activity